MKQIIIFLLMVVSGILYSNYESYLKNYHFKIFSGNKNVGYVNLKIYVSTTNVGYETEIEGYTEIPILFFRGKTKTYEVEVYNKNFLPLKSTLITTDEDSNILSTVDTILISEDEFQQVKYKITKKAKKIKEVEVAAKGILITAGNAIPVVSNSLNFEKDKTISFQFIDKQLLKVSNLIFEYLGRTQKGLHKVELRLPYFGAKFYIYLDDEKNIKFAEGIGLKVIPE